MAAYTSLHTTNSTGTSSAWVSNYWIAPNTTTSSGTSTTTWGSNSSTSTAVGIVGPGGPQVSVPLGYYDHDMITGLLFNSGQLIQVPDGVASKLEMPDGTTIIVDDKGSFTIQDQDAHVIYRANRVRDFNPFVNASDKLEAFIRFCGRQGVRQGEMMEIPVKLFIAWLIIEASKADNEPEPDLPLLQDLRRRHAAPHCLCCGRFISRKKAERKSLFCDAACFDGYERKAA